MADQPTPSTNGEEADGEEVEDLEVTESTADAVRGGLDASSKDAAKM